MTLSAVGHHLGRSSLSSTIVPDRRVMPRSHSSVGVSTWKSTGGVDLAIAEGSVFGLGRGDQLGETVTLHLALHDGVNVSRKARLPTRARTVVMFPECRLAETLAVGPSPTP
ncbi:hypothetical protein [Streptomyces anulatus]|uniref:hypothetical protein n=1 Tax=Streptomyces anulatus TaxID=1892 RepID=UPI0034324B5E